MSGDKLDKVCFDGRGMMGTHLSAWSFELSLQCPDLAHPQRDLFAVSKYRFHFHIGHGGEARRGAGCQTDNKKGPSNICTQNKAMTEGSRSCGSSDKGKWQ